ncbi:hypothetical protein [Rhizobium sp. P32RR-XVIII]|nr:hypothetical protein [Rhizobium sp. P32RR-XVIII]
MRRPADLPLGGRRVELTILARRFWCDGVLCGDAFSASNLMMAS